MTLCCAILYTYNQFEKMNKRRFLSFCKSGYKRSISVPRPSLTIPLTRYCRWSVLDLVPKVAFIFFQRGS